MAGFRLDGKNPLAYMGVKPTTPPQMVLFPYRPTISDGRDYVLGTMWTVPKKKPDAPDGDPSQELWELVGQQNGINTWIQINAGSDGHVYTQYTTLSGSGTTIDHEISPGTAGQVLTSGGAAAYATYQDVPSSPAYTQYTTLTGSGTSTNNEVSPGTAGQVLTSNGAGAYPTYQGSGGGTTGLSCIYTSYLSPGSGAHVFNSKAVTVQVVCIGGGGGGASFPTSGGTSGGGGSAGQYTSVITPIGFFGGAGASVNFSIGAGGAADSNGNTTTFGVAPGIVTALGGNAGIVSSSTNATSLESVINSGPIGGGTTGNGAGGMGVGQGISPQVNALDSSGFSLPTGGGGGGYVSAPPTNPFFQGANGGTLYASDGTSIILLGGLGSTVIGQDGQPGNNAGAGASNFLSGGTGGGGGGGSTNGMSSQKGGDGGVGGIPGGGGGGGAKSDVIASSGGLGGNGGIYIIEWCSSNGIPPTAPISINTIVFDTPGAGTYVPTSGTFQIQIECQGGGGGSGCLSTNNNVINTGGGAGGGYCKQIFTALQIGASQSYFVGDGGLGGTSVPGRAGNGGDTTFGSFLTAGGGTGAANTGGNTNLPCPGGIGTGGYININGQAGPVFGNYNQNNILGGSSFLGLTPVLAFNGSMISAATGTGYGAGASGVFSFNLPAGTLINGANGTAGVIIITEYIA